MLMIDDVFDHSSRYLSNLGASKAQADRAEGVLRTATAQAHNGVPLRKGLQRDHRDERTVKTVNTAGLQSLLWALHRADATVLEAMIQQVLDAAGTSGHPSPLSPAE